MDIHKMVVLVIFGGQRPIGTDLSGKGALLTFTVAYESLYFWKVCLPPSTSNS